LVDVLHNTKLLLHRLSDLHAHVEESVYSARQLEELEIKDLMVGRDPDIMIASIQRSVTRTEILITDVETQYNHWDSEGRSRRQKQIRSVIRKKYIDKLTVEEIMDELGISKQMVLGCIKEGLDELSARFFGSGGTFLGTG
jgi:YesN/AraC family two-component response regulator